MTQEEKENIQEAIDAIKAFGDYEDALEKQSPLKSFKDAFKGEKQRESQQLLDDFAKAAMHAMLTTPKRLPELSGERLAEMAYAYADIMMQERERRIRG